MANGAADIAVRAGEPALITGASSGIGEALAREFARRGHPLALVARDEARLAAVADALWAAYGVEAVCIAKDLSRPESAEEIRDELLARGFQVHTLVNNAGVGWRDAFADAPLEHAAGSIRVNVEALTRLTALLLPGMLERGSGRVLNLGSIAGFQPAATMAVYHATKAYVVSFSAALREELRGSGVSVTCLCPGPVNTPFFERGGLPDVRARDRRMMWSAEDIAAYGYRAARDGRGVVIPGLLPKLMTFGRHFLPLSLQARIGGAFYKPKG